MTDGPAHIATTRIISVSIPVPDQQRAAHDPSVRDEVLRRDFAPPMFEFTDPDGNVLVYLQEG